MNPQDRKIIPLTDAEKNSPVAKYYKEELAAPTNPAAVQAFLAGPMDPSKAITPNQAATLMESGYVEGENGYCIMPDGTGYLAVNNKFPGATIDMVKWWYAWHALEPLRYKIWNPYCHPTIAIADVDRAKITDPNVSIEDKCEDVVHFVVEDIGGGMQDIVIHFESPEVFGFSKEEIAKNNCFVTGGYGLVENREGQKGKSPVAMLHFFRETEDGVESRTRFWMGYRVHKGRVVKVLPPHIKIPEFIPMGLGLHNIEEYSNLASFLPEIYAEFGKEPLK